MGNKSKRGKRPITVTVGYCHSENLSAFFHVSLIELMNQELGRLVSTIAVLSGPKVDKARNIIMKRWLENTKTDYLFMVDTDMVLPPHTLDRLLKANKDIVGGLCFGALGPDGTVTPTIRMIEENAIVVMWDYPTNSLIQVAATGAACILIKREVAESVWQARGKDHPLPWFAHGMHKNVSIGEDVAFCLTAGKVGYEVWVDTGLEIPHVKPRFVGEGDYVISLSKESHPNYEFRKKVPIYQELLDGDSS